MPDYQTIRGISTFEYEEKRSRFIASAAFADTEEAALAHLNRPCGAFGCDRGGYAVLWRSSAGYRRAGAGLHRGGIWSLAAGGDCQHAAGDGLRRDRAIPQV